MLLKTSLLMSRLFCIVEFELFQLILQNDQSPDKLIFENEILLGLHWALMNAIWIRL